MGSCNSKANEPEKAKNTDPCPDKKSQNQETQTQSQVDTCETRGKKNPLSKDTNNHKSKDVKRNNADMGSSKASERQALVEKSKGKVKSKMKSGKGSKVSKDLDDNKVAYTPRKKHTEANGTDRLYQLDRYRILKGKFRKMDENGDKLLSREEFIKGWEKQPVDNLYAGEVFEQMDKNSSGFVSLSEFSHWYLKRSWGTLIAYFNKMASGSGFRISKDDFVEACKSHALCRDFEASDLFRKLDVNGDGELSIEEFGDEVEEEYIIRLLLESGAAGKAKGKKKKGRGLPKRKGKRPGKIEKFHLICRNGIAELNEATTMEAFNQIDWQMKNRKLSPKEFVEYFKEQGVSKEKSKRLFKDFDKNENGYITFKEFKNYLTAHQREIKSKEYSSGEEPEIVENPSMQ